METKEIKMPEWLESGQYVTYFKIKEGEKYRLTWDVGYVRIEGRGKQIITIETLQCDVVAFEFLDLNHLHKNEYIMEPSAGCKIIIRHGGEMYQAWESNPDPTNSHEENEVGGVFSPRERVVVTQYVHGKDAVIKQGSLSFGDPLHNGQYPFYLSTEDGEEFTFNETSLIKRKLRFCFGEGYYTIQAIESK